jgi:hypothetical protein
LHKELSRALSTVEGARVEFGQQRSRLQATDDTEGGEALPALEPVFSGGGRSILHWMKIGFAFSLPLIIFGFIALFLFFWMASTGR